LLNDARDNLEPAALWDVLMLNEKPGGHGERTVAVGVLDMAVWDAAAKIAGVPLYRLLADRYRGGKFDAKGFVYAAGLGLGATNPTPASSSLSVDSPTAFPWRTPTCGFPIFPELGSKLRMNGSES
jgi:L-alanine-DL-glutamate epimerase-like enolase superfamily enzyme